ncbi:TPA: fimbrial protein [Providencia alcalifaciens]
MKKLLLSFVLFLAYTSVAQAVKVSFRGNLIEGTPCVINNNRPIEVDFGDDLVISLVPTKDGKKYIEDIDFEWECENISSGTDVVFSFEGRSSDFDNALLEINEQRDIALQIYHDSNTLRVNDTFVYTYESDYRTPNLKAALVKSSSSSARVEPGEFTASATLTVAYP